MLFFIYNFFKSRRSGEIAGSNPHSEDTVHASLSVRAPSGTLLHDLLVHEGSGACWVRPPARQWSEGTGATQFAMPIEFSSDATANTLGNALLAAFEARLGGEIDELETKLKAAIDERSASELRLEKEGRQLQAEIDRYRESAWVRLGGTFGLGPAKRR